MIKAYNETNKDGPDGPMWVDFETHRKQMQLKFVNKNLKEEYDENGFEYEIFHPSQFLCEKCRRENIPLQQRFQTMGVSPQKFTKDFKQKQYRVYPDANVKMQAHKKLEAERRQKEDFKQLPHSCILRLVENEGDKFWNYKQSKIDKFSKKEDTNMYRRLSKYDLDSMNIDWKKLMKEKEK